MLTETSLAKLALRLYAANLTVERCGAAADLIMEGAPEFDALGDMNLTNRIREACCHVTALQDEHRDLARRLQAELVRQARAVLREAGE
jgi:hypothetical protein